MGTHTSLQDYENTARTISESTFYALLLIRDRAIETAICFRYGNLGT